MQHLVLATLAAALLATALPAAAQFQRPEQAVKYRQSAMSLQSSHMGRLFAMTRGSVPFEAKAAAENIEIIATLNKLQFSAFVEGSDKVGNTRSLPEIWAEKDKWTAAVAKSQDDVGKLLLAGRSGNLEQIKTAAGAVGQSCDSCHDTFRRK
ncbi:MAG: cytochrome c [Betaproteobacteria bacterium]|nr:cytochrome c [Betaproteobacteria bacterium]